MVKNGDTQREDKEMTLIEEMIIARDIAIKDKMSCMRHHDCADFEYVGMKAAIDVVERRLNDQRTEDAVTEQLKVALERNVKQPYLSEILITAAWQAVEEGK